MFAQLCNSFLAELKTTKQKIMYANIAEDFFVKKKITIAESTKILPFYKAKLTFCSYSLH